MDNVQHLARLAWDRLEHNVVNVGLALIALRCLWDLLLLLLPVSDPLQLRKREPIARSHAEGYSWMPAAYPESLLWRDYNPRDLALCDGRDGGPIRLAIRGNVYDVSAAGRRFYGPDGPYSCVCRLRTHLTCAATLAAATRRAGWRSSRSTTTCWRQSTGRSTRSTI